MAIIGIGNDMVDIRRIEKSLQRFGERFENRVFTPGERQYARRHTNTDTKAIASHYAKRFAAKEACYKALNAGRDSGISWQDIEITNHSNGSPKVKLTGNALYALQKNTIDRTKTNIFLSLSDEYPYAQAFVVIDSVAASE